MIAVGARNALLWVIPLISLMAGPALQKPAEPSASATEAQACKTRALQLMGLSRDAEALTAWREAEAAWKLADDGPGQIEAAGFQAVLESSTKTPPPASSLERAIGLAERETRRLEPVLISLVNIGRAFFDRSLMNEARRTYETAVRLAGTDDGASLGLASALSGLGNIEFTRRDLQAALGYYRRASAIRQKLAPESLDMAGSFNNLGNVSLVQGDLAAADDLYRKALVIRERLAPDSLLVSATLHNLGNVATSRGNLSRARDYLQKALAIREKLAPESSDLAGTLNNLGNVARDQSDLEAAQAYYDRALRLNEKLAPGSLAVAGSLFSLGNLAFAQGDLASARDYHGRALAIREQQSRNRAEVAASLGNLGVIAREEGDASRARNYHLQALATFETIAPDSLDVARAVDNLGQDALDQGDFEAAREYYERSLAIRRKRAPDSLDVATSLSSLGTLAIRLENVSVARDYYVQALALFEKLVPDSLSVAGALNNLAIVDWHQGNHDTARGLYERALAIQERIAPETLATASTLGNLGDLAADRNALDTAADYYRRSLSIHEKIAPGSLVAASGLKDLGIVQYRQGDLDAATRNTEQAWSIVRAQADRVTGDDARQAFESHYALIGSQLVQFQVALGRYEAALTTLEEGRARALLQILDQRGVARRLAPPDAWRAYEIALATANRAGKSLEQTKTEEARQAFTRARVTAEREWAGILRAIQAAVPAPMTVADARSSLPPDTILAAFAVGDDASTLFIVQRAASVRAYSIELSAKELAARVKSVRDAASREGKARAGNGDEDRIAAARALYGQLFPAEARTLIARSKRLLLSPDGVLWDLPFAALVVNDKGDPAYLGLETPIVYTQSLTAFARMRQATPGAATGSAQDVVVIGNPLYGRPDLQVGRPSDLPVGRAPRARAVGELRLLSHDGTIPPPLPYADEEAREVAALYGVKASTAAEPTERWFRQRAVNARIIHLATHGYFNAFRAIGSGVRLAVPESQASGDDTDNDGALQAWEVFTQFRLQADLVVLSACQTGVGAKVPGEGLVGLTRAFQAAGASSIVATHWSVADRSTASGMVAFHRHLRKGVAKDEALRLAMRTLAGDPATKHPFYWAPFMLVGDFDKTPNY